MEENIVNSVLELYRDKNWSAILDKYHDHPERNKLLWVFPTVENIAFLKNSVQELGCVDVLSVGCGSGLLEWIVTEACGIPVRGLEVDSAWWRCKYAPPTFIPLLFTPATLDKDTISLLKKCDKTALMFCYFNNREAFEKYLEHYPGNVLVIIGPGDGKGVHTDPRPFGDVGDDWLLHKSQEVRDSKDFIVIYTRRFLNKT